MASASLSDEIPVVTRRVFLADLGRSAVAFAVLGVACSSTNPTTTATASAADGPVWKRVNLGSVSAYVVARAGEAAVIDTGFAGSAAEIEAAISGLGLGWNDVGHVVLTHSHPDHVGSIGEVLELAADAGAYIGAGDLDAVTAPRPLTAVGDGDKVMSLEVIETPGHTPGHIALLEPDLALLIAGDALTGADGGVIGPNSRFTADMATAAGSIAKLSALPFEIVVFGHGEPVEGDAAAQVAALVATE